MALDAGPSVYTRQTGNEHQRAALQGADEAYLQLWTDMHNGLPFFEGGLLDGIAHHFDERSPFYRWVHRERVSTVAEYAHNGAGPESQFLVRAWLARVACQDSVRLYTQKIEKGSLGGLQPINWREPGPAILRAYTRTSGIVFVTSDGELTPAILRLLPPTMQLQIIAEHSETVNLIKEAAPNYAGSSGIIHPDAAATVTTGAHVPDGTQP